MTRFELATPATRTRCATKLRYIPIYYIKFSTLGACLYQAATSHKTWHLVSFCYLGLLLYTFMSFTTFCYRKIFVHFFGVFSSLVTPSLTLRKIRSAEYPDIYIKFSNANQVYLTKIPKSRFLFPTGENHDFLISIIKKISSKRMKFTENYQETQ